MDDTALPPWPQEGLTRIPHSVYTDARIHRLEQEKIFRGRTWNYVGLEAEIPTPGDFIRSYVGETPVIVTRDRENAVNVFLNRCSHKGVQFCMVDSGHAMAFSCPYHQWSFDLGGRLKGMAFRKGVDGVGGFGENFNLSDHDIPRLAVAVRHGVIFASFAKDTPPLETYLGESNLHYFDRVFNGQPLKILGKLHNRVSTNWKTLVENFKDPYHATLLHVFFATFGIWRAGQPTGVRISPSGGTSTLVQQSPVVLKQKAADDIAPEIASQMKVYRRDLLKSGLADPSILAPVGEFTDDETVTIQTVWPNVTFHNNMNSLGARLCVPRGPGQIDIHWTFFGYEGDTQEMTDARLRHANFHGPGGLVNADDFEVWVLNQRGVETRPQAASVVEAAGDGTGDLNAVVNESAIRAFYKLYRETMGYP